MSATEHDELPRKRPRTAESSRSKTVRATGREDLWFEDGNIVLLTDTVAFKVHRGVLIRHSVVFRDMFSLPQPPAADQETFERVQKVELYDDSRGFGELLSILYDGPKQYARLF